LVNCSGSPLIDVGQMPTGYVPCDCTDGPPLAESCNYAGIKTGVCEGPYKITWDRPVIGVGATICGVGEAVQGCCAEPHAADMPTACECVGSLVPLIQNVPEVSTIVSYSPVFTSLYPGFTYRVDVVVVDRETGCPGTTSFCFSTGEGLDPQCCTVPLFAALIVPNSESCGNSGATEITMKFTAAVNVINFNVEYVDGTCVAGTGCGSSVPPGGGTMIPGDVTGSPGTDIVFTPGAGAGFPLGKIIQWTIVVATVSDGCSRAITGCFGT